MTTLIVAFCNFANAPKKIYKKYAIWQTDGSVSRRHPLSLELQACHLDHNIRCPAIELAIHESLKMTWRNETLKSGEWDLFFNFRIYSQQANILTIPCPVAAACCKFQSLSSDTLMPASVSPSHSANFQTVTVLSSGSGSGSSAPSYAFYLWIPTVWSRASYCSWKFSVLNTSSAS